MADSKYNCFEDHNFMAEVSRLGRGFPVSKWLDDSYFPDEDDEKWGITPTIVDEEGRGYYVEVNRNMVHLRAIAQWRFEIDPSTRHKNVKKYRRIT